MAEPFEKRGKWWSAFKDRHGRWRYLPLKARTRTEARRLNNELQVREDRIREGLDVPKQENLDATFGDLVTWWLENRLRKTRAYDRCVGTVRKHILEDKVARLAPGEVTPGRVDNFLSDKENEVSASTVNHLRAYIRRAFNAARAAERFHGPNPVTRDVGKRKVPRRKPLFLKPEWVPLVLDNVPPQWRGAFATGIYAGLRKGEIIALKKADVDLENRLLYVRRSNQADITKGGHEDGIPIAEELLPYLREALGSPGEWLFPKADGSQHPENVDLVSIIRTALRKARIVTGFVHKCRRKGCGHQEESADGTQRRCPKCSMKMWPVGKVIPIRFHDTRHTTASLLIMFGANPAAVQRILRHSDIRVTMDLYAHLAPNYLRDEINRLSFRPKAAPETASDETAVATANGAPSSSELPRFTSPVLPPADDAALGAIGGSEKGPLVQGLSSVGVAGFEPTTSCSQNRRATSCATPRCRPPSPAWAEGILHYFSLVGARLAASARPSSSSAADSLSRRVIAGAVMSTFPSRRVAAVSGSARSLVSRSRMVIAAAVMSTPRPLTGPAPRGAARRPGPALAPPRASSR